MPNSQQPPSSSSSPSSSSPSASASAAGNSIEAELFYSTPKPGTPANEKWYVDINDSKNRNYQPQAYPVPIHDIRGNEDSTHINKQGFQALKNVPATNVEGDFLLNASQEELEKIYYPQVERLILNTTGASRVVIFDHTLRRNKGVDNPDFVTGKTDPNSREPVMNVHVDQTPLSAHKRVERHVQPPLPYKRFQIINVWRPIGNVVYDYPLAMCDYRTVDILNDLVPTTLIYQPPVPNGETYAVRFNENHRWYYWSEMTPDDVLLLKCYDSASSDLFNVKESRAEQVDPAQLLDGVAGLTPHTAFKHSEGVRKGIKRQSIEVRALVFYD